VPYKSQQYDVTAYI